ncbi:mobile element protein [Celeribacter marinus]|uniref:Mobile element protein n=1 Tax=Celeribacter marinus TaxID=1397108 RepID=A0A0N7HIV9_9RHOB|nr:mobile element protein [Celeribacter marinus]
MGQRHKHLPPAPAMFPDVILDRRVAAHEAMLIAQPLKNPFGSVPLLAVPVEVVLQPLIDEAGEPVQLGPLDLRRSLISGRDRKHHHLRHARTRYPKMVRCRPFAHAAPTREADLPVKFHAENTPALPANRKGQSGKVLLCPQQDNLATSMAHFCIAVLMCSLRYFRSGQLHQHKDQSHDQKTHRHILTLLDQTSYLKCQHLVMWLCSRLERSNHRGCQYQA